ncbi:hypothetical protein PFICI_11997 [Pestalotiopsis fici W106-1]|uniref:Clr5 domain-containing protein n=1 Tax=Pestalotiopsis fici (strain W106-1 / CGMCC3.15140) TaxID=1229662 RepID=W3WRX2_PESFW|nr:uncharacterized protein PFICI_11997 [Pestalotiopsis fici W106-1]ETS76610.1 hypothetical protein PFICI_11997 [Pestalotiopsis fici W106-1]
MDHVIAPETGLPAPVDESNWLAEIETLVGQLDSGVWADQWPEFQQLDRNPFESRRIKDKEPPISASPPPKKPRLGSKQTRSHITPAKWENVKDIISDLYLEKDYTLNTVREIMSKPPHDFHASPKMYKNQFEIWGFAKNITKNRVQRMLVPRSIKTKVANRFNASRIDRYLKRTKTPQVMTTHESDPLSTISELSDPSVEAMLISELYDPSVEAMLSPASELSDPSVEAMLTCGFFNRGHRKYTITMDSNACDGAPFVADSWGRQEYHGLDERECAQSCRCRAACVFSDIDTEGHVYHNLVHEHTHKFGVVCGAGSVFVDIYDTRLLSTLKKAIPDAYKFFSETQPILGACSSWRINGIDLLNHCQELKSFMNGDSSGSGLSSDDSLDLKLLVDGLLEDGQVWNHLDMEHLYREGLVNATIRDKFLHQRLMRGIQSLDTVFKTATERREKVDGEFGPTTPESNPWFRGIYELESSPTGFEFHQDTWDHHRQQVDENEDSNTPLDADTEQQHQIDLNTKLVAACRAGWEPAVTSLLSSGASPSCLVEIGGRVYTPIISAIEGRYESIVQQLILTGANLEHMASVQSEEETLRYTALWAATKTNQPSIVRLLLEHGADLIARSIVQDGVSQRSFTCMSEAARLGLANMFNLLLMWDTSYSEGLKKTKFIDDSHPDAEQAKKLFEAIKMGSETSFVEALEKLGDPNILMSMGTPLSMAAQFDQPDKIRTLLNHGADVQLASLYLYRSGQQQTSKALVKTVFGAQNIRVRFIKQYERLVQLSESTDEDKLKSFKRHCYNYRQAWAIGIETMQNICCGKPPDGPDGLQRTLALLAVARAIAETTVADTGDIGVLDKFDTDLLRWQLLFSDDKDLSPYRRAVHDLWKVDLEGSLFLDPDFEDPDTLGRFNGLISGLIEGARESLGLDYPSGHGLNETFSRWKMRHKDKSKATPAASPAPSILPVQTNEVWGKAHENEPPDPSPESTAPPTCDQVVSRKMILQKTSWLDSRSKAATGIFFLDFTGVAEDLLRGYIFSVVFFFIHGLYSSARLCMGKCLGLVERFIVMLRVLSLLQACERVSYHKVQDDSSNSPHEQDTVTDSVQLAGVWPATTSSNQWYSMIGCSLGTWL